MMRAAYHLVSAMCVLALACGHEASAPSALREPDETAPAHAAPPSPAAAADPGAVARCIDVDGLESETHGEHVTLDGHVFVDELHEHPTRGKTHPYILRLDEPRCALGTDEPRITELHLASIDGVSLKGLAGKHVRVSGDPFSAHTAWHARPVVLMTTKATPLP